MPIIEPHAVGSAEIVAHIDIRLAIVVEVPEHDTQSPVKGGLDQRSSIFIEKSSLGERHKLEPATTQIAIEAISVAQFLVREFYLALQIGVDVEEEPISPFRVGERPAIDRGDP